MRERENRKKVGLDLDIFSEMEFPYLDAQSKFWMITQNS